MSPIKDPSVYPDDWPQIRAAVRERSGGRCECEGECARVHGSETDDGPVGGRCLEQHGERGLEMNGKAVLTLAHLDHDASLGNHSLENLKDMCQRCHLRYDGAHRREQRRKEIGCSTTSTLWER